MMPGPLLPLLPPPCAGQQLARDEEFMRALSRIDPALQSRKKARELGAALHCSREEVYARAAGLGISLAACSL